MNNLIDIQSQIEKLQKQASDIRIREFDKTVQEIRDKMQAFGITVRDLQGPKKRGRKAGPAARAGAAKKTGRKAGQAAATAVAPKYKGPNGELWSGRGLTPRWLATLVEQGRPKDEFLIATP